MHRLGRPREDAERRILVARAGALGDTLMATPVVRALHECHPDAAVDFLCSEAAAPLLANNPAVSRVIELRGRNTPWVLSPEKWRLTRFLRAASYEFAVLLESASHFRALLGYAGIRDIRTFEPGRFDPSAHSIVNNLRAAGFEAAAPCDMDLFVSPEDEHFAEGLLSGAAAPFTVGMHSGYGPLSRKRRDQAQRLKGWDAASFIRLAGMLVEKGARIVLTGAPEDRAEADKIAAALPAGACLQLAGRTTVGQLAGVIRRVSVFVSVDSGPAHMAAALGTPLVVLWGPSRLEQVRPVSSRSPVRIVRHAVFCAPCYDTPMMKECRRNICMESISPARVFGEVLKALESRTRP